MRVGSRSAAGVSHPAACRPAAPRPCRVPRHRVRVASRGAACVSHPAAPRACRIPRRRVRVASRGAASDVTAAPLVPAPLVPAPLVPAPCPARAPAEAASCRLHTAGGDQNAACTRRAGARRATGGASLGEGDGAADPRDMGPGRWRWRAKPLVGDAGRWSARGRDRPRPQRHSPDIRVIAGSDHK
jgi:hypothetical protein